MLKLSDQELTELGKILDGIIQDDDMSDDDLKSLSVTFDLQKPLKLNHN